MDDKQSYQTRHANNASQRYNINYCCNQHSAVKRAVAMKTLVALLLLSLTVFARADTNGDKKAIHHLIEAGAKIFADLKEETVFIQEDNAAEAFVTVDNTENKNLVFKMVSGVIGKMMEKEIFIPRLNLTNTAFNIDIQNASLTGLENGSVITVAKAPFGYDLNNLTIIVPDIVIDADLYEFDNVNLGIIVLNGNGKLRISIKDFRFTIQMKLTMKNLKLVVVTLSVLQVDTQSSKFELENLGNTSPEISQLLNGIAELALPRLVGAISNDLGDILDAAKGDCKDSNLELICGLLGALINYLKDSI